MRKHAALLLLVLTVFAGCSRQSTVVEKGADGTVHTRTSTDEIGLSNEAQNVVNDVRDQLSQLDDRIAEMRNKPNRTEEENRRIETYERERNDLNSQYENLQKNTQTGWDQLKSATKDEWQTLRSRTSELWNDVNKERTGSTGSN